MKIIEAEGINKFFGTGQNRVHVLKDMSFAIEEGDFVAIIGQSGSGKSTLMNILGCLDTQSSGVCRIGGVDIGTLDSDELAELRGKRIGFIFQRYNLLSTLSATENVALPAVYSGVDKKARLDRAKSLLADLGLPDKLENKPNELSGGQQQRVAIARALVKMPRVLLLDEPLSNLDARLRLQTREEIRRIQRETKITTVFVTHDQDEAMSISDFIVVMKAGVVQQIGKPQAVYDDPDNLFVAKFLGTPPINVFNGSVKGGKVYIGEEAVLSVNGVNDGEVYVGIRPEGFILDESGPLGCKLINVEVMGRDVSVVSSNPASLNPTIRSIINADAGVDHDAETVRFSVKPHKLFLFDKESEKRIRFEVK